MATLRSYSATFEQSVLANAAVTRWRFNEDAGATAFDSVDGHDGIYGSGADPGAAGTIGDGAARFDGVTGRVLVADTLSGTVRIATLGDSLADPDNNFQPPGQSFADDLPAALEARGLTVNYFDHAVSGDRTDDGLARVDSVVADNPDVVILELGTNDAIQDINPDTVESNLRDIIADLQAGGVQQILLTGTFGFYPGFNGGSGYDTEPERAAFEAKFAAIANDTPGVVLLNDADGSDKFLGGTRQGAVITGGVLGDPNLNPDGLHPNAAGVDDIVARTRDPVIAAAPAGLIGGELELNLTDGSIELWFTPDSVAGTQVLFSKNVPGGPSAGDIELLLNNDAVVVGMSTDSTTFIVKGGSVAVGEAAHVVLTYGADGMELYVDGAPVASDGFTGGLTGNLEELGIGARSDGNLAFDGVIDEVAVYDRALTAGEIQQLFDGGKLGSTVVGTAADDTIIGGSDSEDLRGRGGDDLITGRDGDDVLRGNAGDDDLRGGLGDDKLIAGYGNDTLSGRAGDDTLAGLRGNDSLAGNAGEDLLTGHNGQDSLAGGADADSLFGGPGKDDLSGGPGKDDLSGNAGDDLLNGGLGTDNLIGGAGGDTFQIDQISDGVDTIQDFAPGEGDVLDLSAVLDFSGGDDPDNFVQLNAVSGDTHVDVDPDGAGGGFTTVFNLIGTTGLNLDTLVADGNVQLE